MSVTFLDKEFESQMKNRILPLMRINLEEGYFKADDGAKIHYGYINNPNAKEAVVISHGFCEFIPKYYELIYMMYEAGYSVYMNEHRGHGYSDGKTSDCGMVTINDFNTYVDDLHKFVEEVVRIKEKGNSLYLYAHSMGGGIAAMYIEKYPADFCKAVLSSPMIEMQYGGFSMSAVKIIMKISKILKWGLKYMPGQRTYDGIYDFEGSCAMSEPRYKYIYGCREADEHYRSYGATYNWGNASINATKYIKNNINRISIPVLLCQAGEDTLVSNEAQDYFVENTQNTQKIFYPEAKHELYNASQEIRDRYYQDILGFLG